MAFMSGTLESLLLYNSSPQSQSGEPVYCTSTCTQSSEPVYVDSHCSLTDSKGCRNIHTQRGEPVFDEATRETVFSKPDYNEGREPAYRQGLYSQAAGPLYSKRRDSRQEGDLQDIHEGKGTQEKVGQQYLKFRQSASRASTSSNDRLRSTGDENWDSLTCMNMDQNPSVWTMSPATSKAEDIALSPTDPSPIRCSSGQRHHPCSSSSLQDVIDNESGTEGFVTTKESRKDSSNQPSEKASTSQDLSNYSKARLNLAALNSPTQSLEESASNSKMLNEQCFQAAISEGFGSVSQTLSYKVRPVKRFSYHVHSNRLHGAKQMGMGHLAHIHNKCQCDRSSTRSQESITMSFSESLSSVRSTSCTCPHDSQDNLSTDSSSQNSKKDFFDKKYRYNHTALALQQSGLMKTTIKTAEILRRGKILQAELSKLGKETTLFMRSVLSNPENQHFRELYMKLHNSKS